MLELLPILQVAQLVLNVAREQIPALQAHKERCTLLINRAQRLLNDVAGQCQANSDDAALIYPRLSVLENTCRSVGDTITDLASKSLAWRLLHQEQMEKALLSAESKLTDAFFAFHVEGHISIRQIQTEIEEASKRDNQQLIAYLDSVSQNEERIIDALRANNLRLEETLMALMKHLQTRPNNGTEDQPSEKFIRVAVGALQRVSSGFQRSSIAHWQITSLEVEYQKSEEDCLGIGGFGKVYRGRWHGEAVAVKEMHDTLRKDSIDDHTKSFEKEIKIWLRLTHPRILPFYGACLEAEKPFLVTKYCQNGNVMDFIREYPEANRLLILHQVSVGMMYLHSQSVIHADLKAANILIGEDDKALICDFGLSRLKNQPTSSQINARILKGTLSYMAPEYIEKAIMDCPADVYSFAMTSWQIFTGLAPFSDIPRETFYVSVVDRRQRPEYPNSMNRAVWALIQECWSHEPAARPTFQQIEVSLKPLVEPYERQPRRLSLSTSQMLLLREIPTPPRSYAGSEGPTPSVPPATPRSAIRQVRRSNEWVSLPPPTPVSYPVSSNSIDAFNSTLSALEVTRSLDDLIQSTLLCYKNWLKPYNAFGLRSQRPQFVLKSRVKEAIKKFKRALLTWVDEIPSLKDADILDRYRTLLLITGTCSMAEYAHRHHPEIPHHDVQDFINTRLGTNAFRAALEGSVRQAWSAYLDNPNRDLTQLAARLASIVNEVCSMDPMATRY